ncbi:MAG: sulfurtransferase [Gemmatimonadetes bacterium]|nr:sulfurtransferase [Gemmatimonadota bacterium]MYH20571.1 sulfurtransferase [Gemmatimonadota bacterium]MYK97682.1 sulfurtransferase [Gemmatimonadota bacterium]
MHTTLIDVHTLNRHHQDPDWCVIDARFSLADAEQGAREYSEGHVPGALYAHLDDDLSGPIVRGVTGRHPLPSVERATEIFSQLGIDGSVQVAVYDDSGGSTAARVWWMLRWLGHDAVAVLDGGWPAWTGAGLPVTQDDPEVAPRTFVPNVRANLVTDVDGVDRHRKDADWVVLDARTPERFRGEQEPIDPVAGHIPGATCATFDANLGEDGCFQSPEELRRRFEGIFGGLAADRAINYCGSGVSACHNLLAIAHAGLGDAVLYPGSWSEWITDEDRPIGTGEG